MRHLKDVFEDENKEELPLISPSFDCEIETRVFQAIALQCLAKIEGISLIGGTLIDNLLGREGIERIKGIHIEQDSSTLSVSIKVEVNVFYDVPLFQKAEEIQKKLVEDVTRLSGFKVLGVHVVFKNLILSSEDQDEKEEVVSVLADDAHDNFQDGF